MSKLGNYTQCSCGFESEDVNFYEIQRSSRGNCSPICNSQVCGTERSVQIFQNDNFPKFGSNCEDALLFSGLDVPKNSSFRFENNLDQEVTF